MKLREAWQRTLTWIDSRELDADKGLDNLRARDNTARILFGLAAAVAVVGLVLALRGCLT